LHLYITVLVVTLDQKRPSQLTSDFNAGVSEENAFLKECLHKITMGLSYFVMKWLLRFSAEVSYNAHPVFLTLLQNMYGGVSKSSQTGRLNRELQMVELSATRYSRIVIS